MACETIVTRNQLKSHTKSNGASNACVPTNTKNHPNRGCGSGGFFCLLRLPPQTLANKNVLGNTARAVATRYNRLDCLTGIPQMRTSVAHDFNALPSSYLQRCTSSNIPSQIIRYLRVLQQPALSLREQEGAFLQDHQKHSRHPPPRIGAGHAQQLHSVEPVQRLCHSQGHQEESQTHERTSYC